MNDDLRRRALKAVEDAKDLYTRLGSGAAEQFMENLERNDPETAKAVSDLAEETVRELLGDAAIPTIIVVAMPVEAEHDETDLMDEKMRVWGGGRSYRAH